MIMGCRVDTYTDLENGFEERGNGSYSPSLGEFVWNCGVGLHHHRALELLVPDGLVDCWRVGYIRTHTFPFTTQMWGYFDGEMEKSYP